MNAEALPRSAWLLGLAGLIPFALSAMLALAGPTDWRATALTSLAAYGATILSFLGAVHWGLALADGRAAGWRLTLGVMPALLAWLALLLPLAWALPLLAAGILGTALIETMAASYGLVPRPYLRLRWLLSLGATACLALGRAAF